LTLLKQKRLWSESIAFSEPNLPKNRQEQKKAMGAWKPPMAFILNSIFYNGTGQTSTILLSQYHQLPFPILEILPIWPSSLRSGEYLTNFQTLVKVFLREL
jgi:hypothetical protein